MARRIPNFQDLGFGTRITESGERLIRKDGSFNISRKGKKIWNAYQYLISMSPGRFIVFCISFFVATNFLFACLFMIVGIEQLQGIPKGSFLNDFLYAFFFSIQTFTTVGYGGMTPVGISANFVASLCASVGLISFALITGLFLARFSRPQSNIVFSEHALLTPYQDIMSLQCRIVNKREHKIIDLSAKLVITWLEEKKGKFKRHFAPLPLERNNIFMFPLNWTIVHPIDEKSPIYGKNLEQLKAMRAEFLIMLSGFDESYQQTLHANSSYICDEILTDVKYKPMYTTSNKKATVLNLDDLDEVIPI